MTPFLSLAALALVASAGAVQADTPRNAPVLGEWLTEEEGVVIRLFECDGDEVCGRIAWLLEPFDEETGALKRDVHNPDETLRDRPWCGIKVIKNLEAAGNDKWKGGDVYNPEDGESYSFKIKRRGPEQLEVRAYLGIGLLGKSETWARAPEAGFDGCPVDEKAAGVASTN